MRRQDVKKVLVIGSGPIVIGQAAEFDYSGTQSLLALREEGLEVVLLNSNPASVMTDPELADRTYVEPVTAEFAALILEREGCDAILPTMGGQTALNVAKELAESGVLEKLGVRLLGSPLDAIRTAEDRALFKEAMLAVNLPVPRSFVAKNEAEARTILAELGLPLVLRPSFTLGGTGGGIARTESEYFEIVKDGLLASPSSTILIEESVLGWKEFELEVLRDVAGNSIVVCSIENLDAMGVHTGDSITVAPSQTLTDKEYQRLRNAAFAVLEAVGIEGGGANVQFAVNPADGRYIIVEMNPRVSRSSALASKATGYPIAKVATKLALGYHLPEIGNAITKTTTAAFEPAIDYVVVKAPRFDFEKFPEAPRDLGTQMRSVGEAMALGRNLREAYQKALRSLERRGSLLVSAVSEPKTNARADELLVAMARPTPERSFQLYAALHQGAHIDDIARASGIDPYFLRHLARIVHLAHEVQRRGTLASIDPSLFYDCKESGLADAEIAALVNATEQRVRLAREAFHLRPRFRAVDTCAGEFAAQTPYFYSGYDHPTGALPVHEGDDAPAHEGSAPAHKGTVIVLGSGPIRIGQGVEFDYACVHAVGALRRAGYRAVMVNSNPETVSTDFDVADRLYFEPLTLENVLEIVAREKPLGVFVQFGGQAPLKLAKQLSELGVHVLGTSPDSIDLAEDRERFAAIVQELGLRQPEGGMARTVAEAVAIAGKLGYPVLVRPSYVLGGRAMRIVHEESELRRYAEEAVDVSAEHPVLVDKFLHHATEVDVDVVADSAGNVVVGGFLEHVEEAGVHSGDAACVIPPITLSKGVQERMRDAATALARRLGVVGLLNVQFAVIGKTPFVLEANPRASRTVPFVAKATGLPLARWAARAMMGESLSAIGAHERESGFGYAVKESVFPFSRFANADVLLGPEMKSTGEVMGAASTAAEAFAKAALAAGANLTIGVGQKRALLFVGPGEKPDLVAIARRLAEMGLALTADEDTARYLGSRSLSVEVASSDAKSLLAALEAGEVALLVATRKGVTELRRAALAHGVPYATTLEGAHMYAEALRVRRAGAFQVQSLQERADTTRGAS